jgi:hypothetical protein
MRPVSRSALLTLSLMVMTGSAAALPPPYTPSPFNIIGYISAMTVDNPADHFSGGTVTVNGLKVIIPTNMYYLMPAAFLTQQDLFAQAPLPYGLPANGGNGQTGLALTDTPTPLANYEVSIVGNRVGDTYIAGMATLFQELGGFTQGFINCIDYADGSMRMGGVIGDCTTGARIKLADPEVSPGAGTGRYGRISIQDKRFTSDQQNPTIHMASGYPVCLPRTRVDLGVDDPLCPQSNRPRDAAGNFLTKFVMAPKSATSLTDPFQQAPFEVGDFLNTSCTKTQDALGFYDECWQVIDMVLIDTLPGVDPAYIEAEVADYGTGGSFAVPTETTLREHIEGFTTDRSRLVDAFAIDVNPCTGQESERLIATINPATQVAVDRYRLFVLSADYLPLFRETHVKIHGATNTISANGLTNGQYRIPNTEFIFGENLNGGDPQIPNNLQDFPFLARGWFDGVQPVPAITPFPMSPAPPPVVCTGTTAPAGALPIASAGTSFIVGAAKTGVLDGTGSIDPNGGTLTFSWAQTGGPAVVLSNPSIATPSFTGPNVVGPTTLNFSLTVTNAFGSASASVAVAVVPVVDTVLITTATWSLRAKRFTVTAASSDTTGAAVLDVLGFGTMQSLGGGAYAFAALSPSLPASVTVRSSEGGFATLPVTPIK